MIDIACAECGQRWPEDELLKREDNGLMVCPECSGLLAEDEVSCQYDEA